MMAWLLAFFILWSSVAAANESVSIADRHKENKTARTTLNIYKLPLKPGVAYRIQTAIGYITTIDLPEEAQKVFIGDADLFKAEVYGEQVLIKPATDYPDARTNLTIYTKTSRLSFDVTVGAAETADFVLDFHASDEGALVANEFKTKLDEKKAALESEYQTKAKEQTKTVEKLTQEKLEEEIKRGTVSKKLKISVKDNGIQINMLSLSEIGGENYLRFSILNYSDHDYEVERIIAGKELARRSGVSQHKEGFVPVDVSVNFENKIPKNSYHYGLIRFEKLTLKKNERFVLRFYEKQNNQPLQVDGIPVEAA